MNPFTLEWIDLAEGDFATCGRELRARKRPNYNSACYHAEQCAEKYLKAYLQECGVHFPKTHDLIKLLDLCKGVDPTFDIQFDLLKLLNDYAVDVRYPGEKPDKDEAKQAYKAVAKFRMFVRNRLGLSGK